MTDQQKEQIAEAYSSFKLAEAGLCGLALRVVGANAEFDRILSHINQGLAALTLLAQQETPSPDSLKQALDEIWGITCPDCGPQDYAGIVAHVCSLQSDQYECRKALQRMMDLHGNDCDCGVPKDGHCEYCQGWAALATPCTVKRG